MQIIGILLILGGVAIYFLTPEERKRMLGAVLAFARGQKDELIRRWSERDAPEEERAQPREPFALITLALVIANLWVFARMLFGAGSFSDDATLIGWGANFGPRTTNGEWWRLVASMFVHAGFLHLLATLCGAISIGVPTERLVGRLAFTIVYFAAGVFAALANLTELPVGANVGPSGAIFGIAGLFLATWAWSVIRRAPIRIPLATLKALAPAVAFFVVYTGVTGRLALQGNLVGFIVGFTCGLVLVIGTEEPHPEVRRLVAVGGAILVLAVAFAVPLRGLSDVRPEISRIVTFEHESAAQYEAAVKKFTDGHIKVGVLSKMIDETILPGLSDAGLRLKSYSHVPREHQPLVTAADEYLRLRTDSWRLRSAALRSSSMRVLQKADREEWQSLDAFASLQQLVARD